MKRYALSIISLITFFKSGTHLLSHTVTSIVPSAAYVLTIVFGMGTGVSHRRIATGIHASSFYEELYQSLDRLTVIQPLLLPFP